MKQYDINKLFELRGKAQFLREYLRDNPNPQLAPVDDRTWNTFWSVSDKLIRAIINNGKVLPEEEKIVCHIADAHSVKITK